ncbi:hypothetical protein [Streptomyces acidiscabies]|uniref:Uncharacterized protein n=1 Tax=Streptomyces acidiscabies TaxID=42234 RepID=A0ABU4M855_9ACTN|nr:hypothetical protein [Streptomyces acidiscabies]MDX3024078.1 hypothetical protein [Streptomyces acidiscabies]
MQMWYPGQLLTAGRMNKMLPLVAYKTATTSRASTTTATADPDLVIPIAASELATYAIEGFLSLTSALLGGADIKVGLSYSGTQSQGTWVGQGTDTSATTNARFFGQSINGNTQTYGVNGGNFSIVEINGLITPTSAGTLSLLWAQNTANATATNMRLGSWLKLTRLDP